MQGWADQEADLPAVVQALLSKIRQRVSEEAYAEITAAAGQFMQGSLPARAFFGRMQHHSISSLVPDMAALLQDTAKREALLSTYADSLQEGQSSGSGYSPAPVLFRGLHDCTHGHGRWHLALPICGPAVHSPVQLPQPI